MRTLLLPTLTLTSALALVGCDYPQYVPPRDATPDTSTTTDTAVTPDTDPGADTAPSEVLGSGDDGVLLPCDVEALLATRCRTCHGEIPTGDSPMSLVTRQDLLQPGRIDQSKTIAEISLQRMRSATKPMPPAPGTPASADEIAIMEAWIAAGAPSGTCEPTVDPLNVNVTCSSNYYWSERVDGENSRMAPGRACIDCHTRERLGGEDEAPAFWVAGTLYPTGHEANNCNGADGRSAYRVDVTDAAGRVHALPVNRVGNFMLDKRDVSAFTYPYTAKVVSLTDGSERPMVKAQDSGDCNACHTKDGTQDAPGRVTVPL